MEERTCNLSNNNLIQQTKNFFRTNKVKARVIQILHQLKEVSGNRNYLKGQLNRIVWIIHVVEKECFLANNDANLEMKRKHGVSL